ncbi:hypothetical protein [Parapedobacter indicus]|nr:hypothetical protein [Parapedobacter indicus]
MSNEILSKAAQVFADESLGVIEVPITPRNVLHRLLMKIGIKPRSLNYQMRKISVGNRYRIASRAVKLPAGIIQPGNVVKSFMEASAVFTDDLIYITAVALQNDRHEPSPQLLDALRWMDDEKCADILDLVLSKMDIQAFMKSIALVVGTENLTEKDPETT